MIVCFWDGHEGVGGKLASWHGSFKKNLETDYYPIVHGCVGALFPGLGRLAGALDLTDHLGEALDLWGVSLGVDVAQRAGFLVLGLSVLLSLFEFGGASSEHLAEDGQAALCLGSEALERVDVTVIPLDAVVIDVGKHVGGQFHGDGILECGQQFQTVLTNALREHQATGSPHLGRFDDLGLNGLEFHLRGRAKASQA